MAVTSRRAFLAAIAAAFALDPERALWVPGKKLISIAAPRVPFDYTDRIRAAEAALEKINLEWEIDRVFMEGEVWLSQLRSVSITDANGTRRCHPDWPAGRAA